MFRHVCSCILDRCSKRSLALSLSGSTTKFSQPGTISDKNSSRGRRVPEAIHLHKGVCTPEAAPKCVQGKKAMSFKSSISCSLEPCLLAKSLQYPDGSKKKVEVEHQ